MDQFLETYKLPIVNCKDIKNLNRPITTSKNQKPPNTVQDHMVSPQKSLKHLKNTNPSQTLLKNWQEGTLPNSFCEASIILITKSDKDIVRKLQTNTPDEYWY